MGNLVRVELQSPASKEWTWKGEKAPWPYNWWVMPRELAQLKFVVVTLVWKVRAVVEEEGGVGGGRGEVPALSLVDADASPSWKARQAEEELKRTWEERWEREGSLLAFVEDV